MTTIAFVHHKGGTGKTTACLNIAGWLTKLGKNVLVVDLDPQGNATTGLGIERKSVDYSIYDVLFDKKRLAEIILETSSGIYVAPSSVDLLAAETHMAGIGNQTNLLKKHLGEVTRVAREVGTEGKLGGQAAVPGVVGAWKELTDNVNTMASNLTTQVRSIAQVTTAVANGDLAQKVTIEARGEVQQLRETINRMVDNLRTFAGEVTRVAKGDLSQKITVEAFGEILELKNTINKMVDSLNLFGMEVTRIAKEVGIEGKLGGQGVVPGDKISKGEMGVQLEIKSNDEIGLLAKSFERMLTAIKILKEDKA